MAPHYMCGCPLEGNQVRWNLVTTTTKEWETRLYLKGRHKVSEDTHTHGMHTDTHVQCVCIKVHFSLLVTSLEHFINCCISASCSGWIMHACHQK